MAKHTKRINKVIKTLILSDFFLQSGWGLIGPIFAIFITQQIKNGSLAAVGFIAATYWLVKSIFQPLVAVLMDKTKGEKDDFWFLIGGMIVANLVPLGYFFSSQLWHLFLLESLRGAMMAWVIPSWAAIFTRHIERGWEAFSWSVESTAIGFAAAFSAAFGGVVATLFGFKAVFVIVTILGLFSTWLLYLIKDELLPKEETPSVLPVKEKQ